MVILQGRHAAGLYHSASSGVERRASFWPEDRGGVISLWWRGRARSQGVLHSGQDRLWEGQGVWGGTRSAWDMLCLKFWTNIRCLLDSSLRCLWLRGWPGWDLAGSSLHHDLRESPFLGITELPTGPVKWWVTETVAKWRPQILSKGDSILAHIFFMWESRLSVRSSDFSRKTERLNSYTKSPNLKKWTSQQFYDTFFLSVGEICICSVHHMILWFDCLLVFKDVIMVLWIY